jgi:hypothetical protein
MSFDMYGSITVIRFVFKMILFAGVIQECGPEPDSLDIQTVLMSTKWHDVQYLFSGR